MSLISKEPVRIAGMFDAIAGRYDALNHLLSAGLDRRWRRRAIRELGLDGGERILDVCTGTADLAIEAVTGPDTPAGHVIGVDFAEQMLRHAAVKVRRGQLDDRVHLVRSDATRLPLADQSVDAVTVGFGIRNVADPVAACREFARVLAPGGRLVILEFGLPRIPGIRRLYSWYFRVLLPRVGRLVSRHGEAYSYLPASVEQFPVPDVFVETLRAIGFRDVHWQSLTFGVVALFLCRADALRTPASTVGETAAAILSMGPDVP